MDGMQVNSAELRNAANGLRKNVTDMQSTLDDSTQTINSTAASWESAAAENLRARYTSLSAKFSDFYDAITKYATFLDNTAGAYEAADKKIEERANELLNQGYNAQ
ncbi:MAG: WXG100 family type VII secretion target [Bacilli bacterium]|nr:WXG100 family type VII secretion target [Bacilli bacterium]